MPEVPGGGECGKFFSSELGTVVTDYDFRDAMAGEMAGQLPNDCTGSGTGRKLI